MRCILKDFVTWIIRGFKVKIEKLFMFDFIYYLNGTKKIGTGRKIPASSSVFKRKFQQRGNNCVCEGPFQLPRGRPPAQITGSTADISFFFVSVTNFVNKSQSRNFSSFVFFN